MRIITIEEHFHHPEVTARVMELAGPGSTPVDFADSRRCHCTTRRRPSRSCDAVSVTWGSSGH
jgi:hypothetical protein